MRYVALVVQEHALPFHASFARTAHSRPPRSRVLQCVKARASPRTSVAAIRLLEPVKQPRVSDERRGSIDSVKGRTSSWGEAGWYGLPNMS